MEAHLVHFNSKYGNLQTAVNKSDGLAVIAFFIQALGDVRCDLFAKISDHIDEIREPKSKCALDSGELRYVSSENVVFLSKNGFSSYFLSSIQTNKIPICFEKSKNILKKNVPQNCLYNAISRLFAMVVIARVGQALFHVPWIVDDRTV